MDQPFVKIEMCSNVFARARPGVELTRLCRSSSESNSLVDSEKVLSELTRTITYVYVYIRPCLVVYGLHGGSCVEEHEILNLLAPPCAGPLNYLVRVRPCVCVYACVSFW